MSPASSSPAKHAPIRPSMAERAPKRSKLHVAWLALFLGMTGVWASGCAHQPPAPRVWIPPRMDLSRLGTLAIVDFASPGHEPLGTETTREFLATLQSAQPGTPVLELGGEERVLSQLGRSELDPDTLRALGEKHHVDAVIVGSLESGRVSPKLALDPGAAWGSASADLEGVLHVKILDTRSGATVWSTASRAKAQLAGVSLTDRGLSSIGGSAPDDARQQLATRLVRNATADFWGHWD